LIYPFVMSGWRQAVFVRQRRLDAIERALSEVLDDESWSPATPRRLRIGSADTSSRGWTMIVPELANFFLDRDGNAEPRLCRLARALHCPAYEVDVRGATTTLFEVDPHGRMRASGAPCAQREIDSHVVGFGLIAVAGDRDDRIESIDRAQPMALADYLGALAGFPHWTRHGDDAVMQGELIYEPPRLASGSTQMPAMRDPLARALDTISLTLPETRAATARTTRRDAPLVHDRRGTRPRSAPRPRR
jgi:hypothetical protein